MSRHPKPHRILVLTLLALVFLLPAFAVAQPREDVSMAAARHDTSPSLLAQLRSLFSVLWQTGSGLDPNGRPGPATTAGDNGSGLDPDGRH